MQVQDQPEAATMKPSYSVSGALAIILLAQPVTAHEPTSDPIGIVTLAALHAQAVEQLAMNSLAVHQEIDSLNQRVDSLTTVNPNTGLIGAFDSPVSLPLLDAFAEIRSTQQATITGYANYLEHRVTRLAGELQDTNKASTLNFLRTGSLFGDGVGHDFPLTLPPVVIVVGGDRPLPGPFQSDSGFFAGGYQ